MQGQGDRDTGWVGRKKKEERREKR